MPTGPCPERPEVSILAATLCCYEERFGPCHPITLRLMTDVAIQLRHRALLERAIRDVQRFLGRTHELRLRALGPLRDLLVAQRDFRGAAAAQRELVECEAERKGCDHPETAAARKELEALLLRVLAKEEKEGVGGPGEAIEPSRKMGCV
ncbi:MAG TPA: hypothetical protein VE999_09750 [Gemmataceae bacterium]|nr:hypothetical protein [Gemmataceae bacterium]